MSKVPQRTIVCDDYEVVVDGQVYHPHEGETITVLPGQTVAEMISAASLAALQPQLLAAQGEPDELQRLAPLAEEAMLTLADLIAPRLIAWTWTDMLGKPLPQPDGTRGPLVRLEAEELAYLITALKGETKAKRGNA